jgi:hypothetical protein
LNFEGDVHVDGNTMGPSHIKAFGHFKRGALLVEARLERFTGSCYARLGIPKGKHGLEKMEQGATDVA